MHCWHPVYFSVLPVLLLYVFDVLVQRTRHPPRSSSIFSLCLFGFHSFLLLYRAENKMHMPRREYVRCGYSIMGQYGNISNTCHKCACSEVKWLSDRTPSTVLACLPSRNTNQPSCNLWKRNIVIERLSRLRTYYCTTVFVRSLHSSRGYK